MHYRQRLSPVFKANIGSAKVPRLQRIKDEMSKAADLILIITIEHKLINVSYVR